MESTTITQEITAESELAAITNELKDFKQDLQNIFKTSQKAESFMEGPIMGLSMSAEQKASLRASRTAICGILDDIDERFGRYL